MAHKTPTVYADGRLRFYDAEQDLWRSLAVGSPGWYAWLEQGHTWRYEGPQGSYTARYEMRVRFQGWYAYRKVAGRLHTAYLGRSQDLTAERLAIVAGELAAKAGGDR